MLIIVNIVQPDHTFTGSIVDYDLMTSKSKQLVDSIDNGGWIDFGEEDGFEDDWADFEDEISTIECDMTVSKMLQSDCKIEKIINMEY